MGTLPAATVMLIGHQIFDKVINRVEKIANIGHKRVKVFGSRLHASTQFLLE